MPQGVKKTSGVAANLLWDNTEYVLGLVITGKPERVIQQHEAFIKRIKSLDEPAKNDEGIQSLLCFLDNFDITILKENPHWEFLQSNPNVSFQLQNDSCLICERKNVIDTLSKHKTVNGPQSVCLITGASDEPERLHPAIKGCLGCAKLGSKYRFFQQRFFYFLWKIPRF